MPLMLKEGWCAPVDARAHTYDLATRAWCASRVPFSRLRDPRRRGLAELKVTPFKTPSTRLYAIGAIHLHAGRCR